MPKKLIKKLSKKILAASSKPKKIAEKPKLSAYVLLDRSGSMSGRMAEALSSINAYVATLAEKNVDAEVTVAAFDQFGPGAVFTSCNFDVIRHRSPVSEWQNFVPHEIVGRGGTPLYDAIDRVVMAAEIESAERTAIIIITDGAENSSRQVSRDQAKARLDKCRARGWDVVYMGADFDAFSQANLVGIFQHQTINTQAGFYGATLRGIGGQSANYATTGMASSFNDQDRKNAAGGNVNINIKGQR